MFTAALDTNTLWPSLQRDFLLSLAADGLYRPVWSAVTLDELEYSERAKLLHRGMDGVQADQRARRLVGQIRLAFIDALVDDAQTRHVAAFGLPDPDDEHVVAAAFVGGAQVIVTEDSDFAPHLLPEGIEAVTPAEFARDTVTVSPTRAWVSLRRMAQRRSQTPVDVILERLDRVYGMGEACALLRDAADR